MFKSYHSKTRFLPWLEPIFAIVCMIGLYGIPPVMIGILFYEGLWFPAIATLPLLWAFYNS